MRFGRRVVAIGALVAALGDVLLVAAVLPGGGGPLAALFPGLFLLGAGQGLCMTPLTTTVLSHADPSRAGSVSGALSTAQQVGNAIGVAVSGVIFYGLLGDGDGYGAAYRLEHRRDGRAAGRRGGTGLHHPKRGAAGHGPAGGAGGAGGKVNTLLMATTLL